MDKEDVVQWNILWIYVVQWIYTMEFYSAMKNNKIMSFAAT